jgi:hypothetical protein
MRIFNVPRPTQSTYHDTECESVFAEICDNQRTLLVGEICRVPDTNDQI